MARFEDSVFSQQPVHTDFASNQPIGDSNGIGRRAASNEFATRRSTAVMSLQVLLHERIIRPPLDFALILLGLPLVVNRRGRNLFVMIGAAMLTVLAFFFIKTLAGAMGGSGYLLSPTMAAWVPLLIIGPVAYVRFRDVQLV